MIALRVRKERNSDGESVGTPGIITGYFEMLLTAIDKRLTGKRF